MRTLSRFSPKIVHHVLCMRMRRHFTAALLALGCIVAAINAPAATISWSGAGGDNLWSNPTNWNGGALPTADDDVVINAPGTVTVRMDVLNATVRRLQCQESFLLESGNLKVTAGPSVINGAFHVAPGLSLEAHGPGTVLTLNGTVTNVWGLTAMDGGVIALPTARQLTVGIDDFYLSPSVLSAIGTGSAILMTNLTNVVIAPYDYLRVAASGGGRIDLRRLQMPDGPIEVSAENPDSLVDLSSLSGLWAQAPDHISNWLNSLTASDGGTVLIPNVTACDKVTISLSGSANIPLAQVRSFTRGALDVTRRTNDFAGLTNFSGGLTATHSRLNLTNLTVLYGTNGGLGFKAQEGSVIDLSRVTNVVADPWSGFTVRTESGGRIDLRRMRVPEGPFNVVVDGAGSMVDLSGLNGEWASPPSTYAVSGITANNGGTVLISNVTSMRYLGLSLSSDAVVPTAQLRSFTDGGITLLSRTNRFEGLTNFTGSISATDARLDLTNFTILSVPNGGLNFTANQGSIIDLSRVTNIMDAIPMSGYGLSVSAQNGSRIDLRRLRVPEVPVSATAEGADSLVDLSGFYGRWLGGNISASSGGTIRMPNVTALEGVRLDVRDTASVNLAQLTSIGGGGVVLVSRTNDFPALTNFTGTLSVTDTLLDLTNCTQLYATNGDLAFAAVGSSINLSNVTNVVVHPGYQFSISVNAGSIDVHRARVPEGTMDVRANAGGIVDLSALDGLWTPGPNHALSSVQAGQGGSVLISNVTAMHRVKLSISDEAVVPTAQLTSHTEGGLSVSYRTNVFSSLTNLSGTMNDYAAYAYNAHLTFPSLTHLHGSNYNLFFAQADALIDLTRVTNSLVGASYLYLYAFGGRIDLPGVESVAGSCLDVRADGPGAVVDLRGLTSLLSDNNRGLLQAINGGTILLNTNAMLLAGVAVDFQSNPGGPVPPFLAPSQSLVLYGQPWRSYRVESRDPLVAGSPWQLYQRVPLTSPFQNLGPRPDAGLALRVMVFIADPPEMEIRLAAPGTVETIIHGVPGRTYRLDTKTSVDPLVAWQDGGAVALTNSFAILPGAATNTIRAYRARQL